MAADVTPLLPSAASQSRWSMTSTGLTTHQTGCVFTRELSTTEDLALDRRPRVPGIMTEYR